MWEGFHVFKIKCEQYLIYMRSLIHKYLIQLDYDAAHKKCCAIGMQLLSVESSDTLNCLTKMVDKYPEASELFFVYPFCCETKNRESEYVWALEKDFWTSGTSTGCAGTFEWCSKNARFARRESLWRDGHPVGEEACVTIALFDKLSGKNSSLASSPCQEIKPFICEATKLAF
jgi:hypothetical protein